MNQDPGKAAIYKNEDATPQNNQPHYRGQITTPGGEVLRIALWVTEIKSGDMKGKKMFSGRVEPPREQGQQTQAPVQATTQDDDIPF